MPFRRRTRTRERTEWTGLISVVPSVVAVNTLSSAILLAQATMEEWPGARVDRLLLSMFVSPATGPAAASGYGVFIGITVTQIGVGGGLSYDPELMPEHRWLWWTSLFPQIGGTGAADQNVARWAGYFPIQLDRRIRRRLQEDENLILFVKNSASSAASVQYSITARILLALGRK